MMLWSVNAFLFVSLLRWPIICRWMTYSTRSDFQRIPRYRLLLETILLYTPIESSIRSSVEESLNAMGKIASKINADVSLQQQKNKVK